MIDRLIEGEYYYTENGIEKCHYCEVNGCNELVIPKGNILDKVPSFEEYEKLKKDKELLGALCERFLCIEEKKWEELVKNGTKEEQIDFLLHKEKYSFLALSDKYMTIRDLLKECKGEFEAFEMLGHLYNDFTDLHNLSTRINAALGESEGK